MAESPRPARSKVPQELWDNVAENLLNFDARQAAGPLEFRLQHENRLKHANVWSAIFRDSRWATSVISQGMMPLLIGMDLSAIYNGQAATDRRFFVALCLLNQPSGYKINSSDFLASLKRPYDHNESRNEITFEDSGMILNVENVWHNTSIVELEGERLFLPEGVVTRSGYLLWRDPDYEVKRIDRSDCISPRPVGGGRPGIWMLRIVDSVRGDHSIHFIKPGLLS
ncbi:MAG: hypothetical protein Q9182_004269 [Xanthomendoza sp. 2 TL-2023]